MDIQDVHVYVGKYSNGFWGWTDINNYTLGVGRTLMYRRCSGLEDFGKVKNIYTETYADSDTVRVDFPTTITREATTITLNLIIRRNPSIENGDNDVSTVVGLVSGNYPVVLWDNIRRKMSVMTLVNAVEVKEDKYKGMKYVEIELKFNNLYGYCPYVSDTFTQGHLPNVEAAALPIITKVLS
jgi:hypothetical protein